MDFHPGPSGWTDDRVNALKSLWADGLSAGQIASKLGYTTRNAVIGKLDRLGLMGRLKSSTAAPRERKPMSEPRTKRPPSAAFKYIAHSGNELLDLFIPPEQRCTLLELTDDTCRWPVGDPAEEEFYFCGGQTLDWSPYCATHSSIAYLPLSGRKLAAGAFQ